MRTPPPWQGKNSSIRASFPTAPGLLRPTGMAIAARIAPPPLPPRNEVDLPSALCAAELGEPVELKRAPMVMREILRSATKLRASVPYATLKLLERLSSDERSDVRANVAEALPHFADAYPKQVDGILRTLASDSNRRVRSAALATLATIRSRT